MIHNLKIWPEYFEAVKSGIKTFEARVNDRGYRVDDILHLREWSGQYTGREVKVKVTYTLQLVGGPMVMSIVPYEA